MYLLLMNFHKQNQVRWICLAIVLRCWVKRRVRSRHNEHGRKTVRIVEWSFPVRIASQHQVMLRIPALREPWLTRLCRRTNHWADFESPTVGLGAAVMLVAADQRPAKSSIRTYTPIDFRYCILPTLQVANGVLLHGDDSANTTNSQCNCSVCSAALEVP